MERRPITAFANHCWRLHEMPHGLAVGDVWALRIPDAGPSDFPLVLDAIRRQRTLSSMSGAAGALFAVRWAAGKVLRLDKVDPADPSLADLVPVELKVESTPQRSGPFVTLYETQTECANEIRNRMVHAVQHLGWVQRGDSWELQMTVLVRPRGGLGHAYMALISPFRHGIVYEQLGRMWLKAWTQRS